MKELEGARLNLETEFFRKTNNLTLTREKTIRTVQVKGVHLLLALLLILALGYVANRFCQFLLTWEKLNIRSYRLVNAPRHDRERVDHILKSHRGSILTLNLKELKGQLMEIGEIEGVSVSRILPSAVEVVFDLRKPFFQIRRQDRFWMLDAEGRFLYPLSEKDAAVMTIDHTGMSDVESICRRSADLRKIADRIEYVGFRPPFGLELKLNEVEEVFYPGSGDLADKLDRYFRIKHRLQEQSAHIRHVDLRMTDRIYLEFPEEGIGANEK